MLQQVMPIFATGP